MPSTCLALASAPKPVLSGAMPTPVAVPTRKPAVRWSRRQFSPTGVIHPPRAAAKAPRPEPPAASLAIRTIAAARAPYPSAHTKRCASTFPTQPLVLFAVPSSSSSSSSQSLSSSSRRSHSSFLSLLRPPRSFARRGRRGTPVRSLHSPLGLTPIPSRTESAIRARAGMAG